MNNVRDYNKLQGTKNPADLCVQIIRDINYKYITIENSSNRDIGVNINLDCCTPSSNILFVCSSGEVRHLGVNTNDSPTQFIHLIDLQTKKPVSDPKSIQSGANQYVLRDGINKWWVQPFYRSTYKG